MPQRTEGGRAGSSSERSRCCAGLRGDAEHLLLAVSLLASVARDPPRRLGCGPRWSRSREQKADRLLEGSRRAVGRAHRRVGAAGQCAIPRRRLPYHFACRYATGWLASAHGAPPPRSTMLIFDASISIDIHSLHVQALELSCVVPTASLTLPSDSAPAGAVARALRSPDAALVPSPPPPGSRRRERVRLQASPNSQYLTAGPGRPQALRSISAQHTRS